MQATRSAAIRRRPPVSRLLARTAAVALLLPGAAWAQERPQQLSLPQAVQMAKENNPEFLQQQNDISVARSAVRSAYGDLLPSASASTNFGYTAPGELRLQSRVFGSEPEAYFSSYSLGVSYQISGNTLLQPSVQRSQRRATERRVSGVAANLEAQVSQQYLSVLQGREQVDQAVREVARADEYVKLAEARLEVGAGTPLDVRRAQVQKGQAEVNLVQARNTAATAALTLGQLMGVEIDPEVQLTSEFTVFDPEWSASDLVNAALGSNPSLLAARASSSAASTQVQAARTAYLPSLSFSMGWRGYVNQYGSVDPLVDQQLQNFDPAGCERNNRLMALIGEPARTCTNPADPAVREAIRSELEAQNRGFPFDYINQPWQASVGVSLPIFTGFSRQLQVDQAKAQAADARHQVRAEELRLRQAIGSGVLDLETAYQTVLLMEQVRENATEELRLAQERFRFGAASSVEVTDAQTNLSEAERDLIDAVYNFHKALATLEALVGRPMRAQ